MHINTDDIRWLQQIFAGLVSDEIPEFDRSRLQALELIDESDGGLTITSRGQEALARHFGLQRP